jgi:AcrR family transcriptional regulator
MKKHEVAEKVDRRIQKTRKILIDALIALTVEKGYENVTVQDIIDRANVGRSTFYSHFESKDQLLIGNDHFQDLLSKTVGGYSRSEINFTHIYEHVAEYHQLARIFLGKNGNTIVSDHFHNIFVHVIKEHFKPLISKEKLDKKMFKMLVEAAASAMCSLLFTWATTDMPFPISEMVDKSHGIVNSIFKRYL